MMMRFARRSPTFWTGLFLLVFGGVFLSIGWSLIRQAEQYQREGRQSSGVVLTKAIQRATRTGSNQRSETKYTVTYRFTVEDGRSFEGSHGVSVATWDRLREKEPIQIEYIASDPATNRVAGETSGTLGYIFGGIGFVAAFIGALVFARSLNTAKARARIWTQGTQADATVAAVEETNVRVNRRPMWIVRYQYRDHSGQSHDGASDYISAEKAHAWKTGDRIRVRFDPQKPGMSVWRE